jgi:hypothetical protein
MLKKNTAADATDKLHFLEEIIFQWKSDFG